MPKEQEAATQQSLALLNEFYQWPALYPFKFVVPVAQQKTLEALLKKILPPLYRLDRRRSKEGRYISITCSVELKSGEEVLAVHAQVKTIEGLIAL